MDALSILEARKSVLDAVVYIGSFHMMPALAAAERMTASMLKVIIVLFFARLFRN